jgi:threonine dehydrogenase-like Zn-dependent dehydrogenase
MSPEGAGAIGTSGYLLTGPLTFERRELELPPLRPDWVRVRFIYCGICGSDLSQFEGRREASYPLSLGHEFVAEVVAVGADVTELQPGDAVTSDLNFRCRDCDQCRAGRSHLCRMGQIGEFSNRAFCDLGDLHASYLLPLREGPLPRFALVEPLSCVLHAKNWASPDPTERILVIGGGGLGICLAFALCQQGASFDIAEQSPSRASQIESAVSPLGRLVPQPKEDEYDVVFDLSGSESGLKAGCRLVKPGGRLCSMSHLDGHSDASFLLAALTRRDVSFTVSYLNGEWSNLETAVSLLEDGWSATWEGLLRIVSVDDLQREFETRRAAPWCKTVIDLKREPSQESR